MVLDFERKHHDFRTDLDSWNPIGLYLSRDSHKPTEIFSPREPTNDLHVPGNKNMPLSYI